MDPQNSSSLFSKITSTLSLAILLTVLMGCDKLTWYKNSSLGFDQKTHFHLIQQSGFKFSLRVFQFRKQTVLELEPISSAMKNSMQSSDVSLSADGKNLRLRGFINNYQESQIAAYKPDQLLPQGNLLPQISLAIVFDPADSKELELKIFGISYRFEKDSSVGKSQ